MALEAQQPELEGYAKGKKLHEQLEASGAYEKVSNRRGAQLLQAYLPTEASLAAANLTLDKPLKSPSVARQILYRTMRQAFPYLDEQTRQEYGTPEAAIRPRTQANLITAGRRGLAALMEAYHSGNYTGKQWGGKRAGSTGGRREPGPGKTLGRPRKVR